MQSRPGYLSMGQKNGTPLRFPLKNIIRDNFVETKLPPRQLYQLNTNTQACVSSIQVYSWDKDEEINGISYFTVAPIEVQEIRTDDSMVVLI